MVFVCSLQLLHQVGPCCTNCWLFLFSTTTTSLLLGKKGHWKPACTHWPFPARRPNREAIKTASNSAKCILVHQVSQLHQVSQFACHLSVSMYFYGGAITILQPMARWTSTVFHPSLSVEELRWSKSWNSSDHRVPQLVLGSLGVRNSLRRQGRPFLEHVRTLRKKKKRKMSTVELLSQKF